MSVHEWCEIRLIRSEASEQGAVGFGIRGGLFGYFLTRFCLLFFGLVELTFTQIKSDKRKLLILF